MQSNTSTQSHALRIEAQPTGLFETPIAYGRLKDADVVMKELEDVMYVLWLASRPTFGHKLM